MLLRPKYKQGWQIKPNNSDAALNRKLYQTNICINTLNPDLLLGCLQQIQSLPQCQSFTKTPVLIDSQQLLKGAVEQLKKSAFIFVKIFSQYRLSYRGFVSYILLVDRKNSYLIDAVTIRNHIDLLGNVFNLEGIVKFVFDLEEVNFAFQREFHIQIVNVFDLKWLETQNEYLSKLSSTEQQKLQEQLQQIPQLLTIRPACQKYLKPLYRSLPLLSSYIPYLPKPSICILPQYLQVYNSALLQKHHPPHYPPSHQNTHCLSKQQFDDLNKKQQKLYNLLLDFREHVARISDVNVELVMPKRVIKKILECCASAYLGINGISVLDICGMYEQDCVTPSDLELCKRIYDVIRLAQQQYQDTQKLHQLFTNPPQSQSQHNLKKSLQDLQWGNSIQWLNRKDDPSIRLYKEIISIKEFDYSVGEEYINKMKGDVFKKGELQKYLKFAQYMRNRNYQKLEKYYDMVVKANKERKEEEFSEGADGEFQDKNQKTCCRQLFQDKQQTMPSLKSTQSLQQKLPPTPICNPPNSSSSSQTSLQDRSRKSSQTLSFNITDLDEMTIKRSDIRPLPNTIQEIYELAQEVKKKNDRKVKKKDKKSKNQVKKENDFVPNWADIQELLTAFCGDQ